MEEAEDASQPDPVAVIKLDITDLPPSVDSDGEADDQEEVSLFILDGNMKVQEAMVRLMEKKIVMRKMIKQGGRLVMSVKVGKTPTKIKMGSDEAKEFKVKLLTGFKQKRAAGEEEEEDLPTIMAKALGKKKPTAAGYKTGSPSKRMRD